MEDIQVVGANPLLEDVVLPKGEHEEQLTFGGRHHNIIGYSKVVDF